MITISHSSWRFVDGKQTFAYTKSPLPVDESKVFSKLAIDMNDENFLAINVYDVNATATHNVAGPLQKKKGSINVISSTRQSVSSR